MSKVKDVEVFAFSKCFLLFLLQFLLWISVYITELLYELISNFVIVLLIIIVIMWKLQYRITTYMCWYLHWKHYSTIPIWWKLIKLIDTLSVLATLFYLHIQIKPAFNWHELVRRNSLSELFRPNNLLGDLECSSFKSL